MSFIVAAFGFGLVSMSIIAISAVGFTMQFGITNMINLAYGQVMIASAYAAYAVNNAGVSIWLALPVAAGFGAVFSFLLNRLVYAPFQRKGTNLIGMVIISLAVSLVIANVMLPIAGYYSVSYQQNPGPTYHLGSIALTGEQLAIIGVAVVVMLAIHALLRFTRLGKAMRATAANPTLARNCGIPTSRVIDLAWLITGALCGIAGAVAGMNSDSFSVASGSEFLIPIIAASILGGAGSPVRGDDRRGDHWGDDRDQCRNHLARVQAGRRFRGAGTGHGAAASGPARQTRRTRGRRVTYYLTTILVYAAVDILACLAISLQFGVSGIVNFSFIIFQAAGAYTAGVLSLPSDTENGGFQTYILGLHLTFPLPWIGATLVGALLAIPIGLVALRRLRSDYQAIAMLVLSVIASLVVTNTPAFLDGAAGLSLVPQPLVRQVQPVLGRLPVGLHGRCVGSGRDRLLHRAAGDQLAIWTITSSHARERDGCERARQECGCVEDDGIHPGWSDRRVERRDPGRLHHDVGAIDVALPGNADPVRGRDRRRSWQQLRRGARSAARSRGIRGSHPLSAALRAAGTDPRRSSGCASAV